MFEEMLNRTLKSVVLSPDKETVEFTMLANDVFKFRVEGDCCSHSWIEHLTVPDDIDGAVLLSVEEGNNISWDAHKCDGSCPHDHLQVYNTHFKTTRGDVVLEYRNDSNGYYGGYIVEDYTNTPLGREVSD